MLIMPFRIYVLFFALSTLLACQATSEQEAAAQETEKEATEAPKDGVPRVKVVAAEQRSLSLRRQSNGRLRARQIITLKSRSAGLVVTAPEEGQYYAKGSLLLQIDPQPQALQVAAAKTAVAEADFRLQELTIRMENASGSDTLTRIQKDNILIQSGLPTAKARLAEAEWLLSQSRVEAPFSAVVADVQIQAFDQVSSGEIICQLIDLSQLEVEFFLLEKELMDSPEKQSIYVTLSELPDLRIAARLEVVNPKVDDNGLVRVRALLQNPPKTARLFPGRNVGISLENRSPSVICVPKSAVVLRSNKAVVFVYDSTSKRAEWRYVTVAYENDQEVGITEGLQTGDLVMYSGHINLDHQSPVDVE